MQSEGIQMEIKVLHQHGWSIGHLAREFGLSWNTVKRIVTSLEPRRYPRRACPTALTASQAAHIERRLAMCPTIRGTILHHELCRDYSYSGSYPAFVRHLRALRPVSIAEPIVRFETDPGRQVQVDWAHLGRWPLDGALVDLYAFVAILGYSRTPAVRFATDHTRETSIDCLLRCLDDLGGVPDEILTDRDSVFCIGTTSDGRAVFAPEWIDLCSVLDVVPRACRPYRAQTKGKVERMVREVKESLLAWLTGQILPPNPGIHDYDRLGLAWREEIILPRTHRTTGQVIGAAWAEERALLRSIPPVPLAVIDLASRLLGEYVEVRDLAEYEVATAGGGYATGTRSR